MCICTVTVVNNNNNNNVLGLHAHICNKNSLFIFTTITATTVLGNSSLKIDRNNYRRILKIHQQKQRNFSCNTVEIIIAEFFLNHQKAGKPAVWFVVPPQHV